MWYSLFKHTRCYHNSQFVLLSITLHILWILLYYIVTFNRKSDLFKLYFFTYNLKSFYYWCGTVLSVSTNFFTFHPSKHRPVTIHLSFFILHERSFSRGTLCRTTLTLALRCFLSHWTHPFFFHESDSYFHPSSE